MHLVTITEYQTLTRGVQASGCVSLTPSVFDSLKQFILTAENEDITDLFSLSIKKGIGEVLTAKNYVGVLKLKNGTEIEILPKIASANNHADSRKVLMRMLKTLKDTPFKLSGFAELNAEKTPLFEIFIRMFIDEAMRLHKQGFRSAYVEHHGNERYLKGKLLLSQHLKHNTAHQERFYVQYDEFSINRPANRLIKSTIELLHTHTHDWKNKKDLHYLLACLDEVECSKNYDSDFSKIVMDRNLREFQTILQWCRIFLKHESFTSFTGQNISYALLFKMDTLFESYVATRLKKTLGNCVRTQDRKHHLFTEPKKFPLRPDIVIENEITSIIIDTKWKILEPSEKEYGISTADMYQMYAYHAKYNPEHVTLLYPATDKFGEEHRDIVYYSHEEKISEPRKIQVRFIDLLKEGEEEWKSFAEMLIG